MTTDPFTFVILILYARDGNAPVNKVAAAKAACNHAPEAGIWTMYSDPDWRVAVIGPPATVAPVVTTFDPTLI
jgi:hypothetical protein